MEFESGLVLLEEMIWWHLKWGNLMSVQQLRNLLNLNICRLVLNCPLYKSDRVNNHLKAKVLIGTLLCCCRIKAIDLNSSRSQLEWNQESNWTKAVTLSKGNGNYMKLYYFKEKIFEILSCKASIFLNFFYFLFQNIHCGTNPYQNNPFNGSQQSAVSTCININIWK